MSLVPHISHSGAARSLVSLALDVLGWHIYASMQANSLLPATVRQLLITVEESKVYDPLTQDFDSQMETVPRDSVLVRRSSI